MNFEWNLSSSDVNLAHDAAVLNDINLHSRPTSSAILRAWHLQVNDFVILSRDDAVALILDYLNLLFSI